MKRLLVIADFAHQLHEWRRDNNVSCDRCYLLTPFMSPDLIRGLSEENIAIVWLCKPALSERAQRILNAYVACGAPQFGGYQTREIKQWLGLPVTAREWLSRFVFSRELVEKCIVDKRPGGCLEIADGTWLRCEWILPTEPQWSPYS